MPIQHYQEANVPSENMTLDEVATEFKISPATLRYWRHQGTGPKSFKLGRRVRYRRADVEQWIQEQYQAQTASA